MPRVSDEIQEAIDWLREWASEGCPRRVDGSFPPDFITAMRRLMDVPAGVVSYRHMEEILCAGPDFDVRQQPPVWNSADVANLRSLLQ